MYRIHNYRVNIHAVGGLNHSLAFHFTLFSGFFHSDRNNSNITAVVSYLYIVAYCLFSSTYPVFILCFLPVDIPYLHCTVYFIPSKDEKSHKSVQCWSSVVDGGPTLSQLWVNDASLLRQHLSCLLIVCFFPVHILSLYCTVCFFYSTVSFMIVLVFFSTYPVFQLRAPPVINSPLMSV